MFIVARISSLDVDVDDAGDETIFGVPMAPCKTSSIPVSSVPSS
jgi:hypothetical protein